MDGNRLIPIYTPANRLEADLLMDALHRGGVSEIASEKGVASLL